MRAPRTTRLLALTASGVLALGLSACTDAGDEVPEGADLIAGKQAFLEECGSCHVMERAGTQGTQGPDLDEAFRQSLADGLGRGGVRGIVAYQIAHPNEALDESSPAYMPADLVTGPNVDNVAAYVGYAAARPGEDTGSLFGTSIPEGTDGETIFGSMCLSCHILDDAGTAGSIGPNLDDVLPGQDVEEITRSIVEPNAASAPGYQRGIMPDNYGSQLRDDQIQALSEYLADVAGD